MRVTIQSINVPDMSTVGYGVGTNEQGDTVHFAGDHRPMRELGAALEEIGEDYTKEWPEVDIEDWQILAIIPKGTTSEELRDAWRVPDGED